MAKVTVTIIVGAFLATLAFATQLCPACGAANPDENNFCEACGSPLKPMVTCPQCGEKYPEGTVACSKCGYTFLKPKTVMIIADPLGATIFVNGVELGKGRVEATLAPGEEAVVEARLEGYVTVKARCANEEAAGGDMKLKLARKARVTERGGLGVGIGYAQPVSSTGASISGSPTAELRVTYRLVESVEFGAAVGYHFKHTDKLYEIASIVFTPVTASFSYLIPTNGIIVFLSAGGGYYFWEAGNVTGDDPGLVAGAGVRFPMGEFYVDCGTEFDLIMWPNDYGKMVGASVSAGYYLF